MSARQYSNQERKLRRALGTLIVNVRCFEAQMDAIMQEIPETKDRPKRIASLMNDLVMANDQALYFGLGFDFRKDTRMSKPNIKKIAAWSRKMYYEAP